LTRCVRRAESAHAGLERTGSLPPQLKNELKQTCTFTIVNPGNALTTHPGHAAQAHPAEGSLA
jgi:hypothetical protein